jgi:sugar O-acyltransferase (sialic acid O-acetyltransferase NeuD family)
VEKVVLFGTGAQARDAHLLLSHDSPYEVAAFAVDREHIEQDMLFSLPVVPFEDVESIYPPADHRMHIAVGYSSLNRLRAERYHQAKAMGYQLISHVSSKATTWPGLIVGENCLIGPNVTIYPSCKIGNNIVIGTGCIVPHYSTIEDHCFLAAGVVLSGWVTVKPYCYIGTGAIIRNNVTIARECVIGAGAVILEDTEERGVYMGKPADLLPISSDKLPLG